MALVALALGALWCCVLLPPVVCYPCAARRRILVPDTAAAAILCAPFALVCSAFWAVAEQLTESGDGELASGAARAAYGCFLVIAVLLYGAVLANAPAMQRAGVFRRLFPEGSALTFPAAIVPVCLVRSTALSDGAGGSWPTPLGRTAAEVSTFASGAIAAVVIATVSLAYTRALCTHRRSAESANWANVVAGGRESESGDDGQESC
jgi:tellurite resistance protein TehA-like permease